MTLRVALVGYELFGQRVARNLRAVGVAAKVMPKPDLGTLRGRLRGYRFLLASDVVLAIGGRTQLGRHERVLIRCGLPVVIYWLGTDVLEWRVGDRYIVRRVWNRAVAPWLADELEAEGLPRVELAPWACEDMPEDIPRFSQPFTVVAYTPQARLDFYGIAFVVELARRLPDVRVRALGDHTEGRAAAERPDARLGGGHGRRHAPGDRC